MQVSNQLIMKRIIYILLTSIIFVAAFVCLKYITFGLVMPKANYGMRAICSAREVTDLYLGSSMFRQGIDACELGDQTYLLAYSSNRPFHEAMQLKNLIDNGAKIKRVIVDMYPYSIVRDVGISDIRMIQDGDMKYTFNIYSAMHKIGYPITTLYDMLILQNNELFLTMPITYWPMNSRYVRGSNPTVRHGKSADDLATLEPKTVESLVMNKSQIDGLNQIIQLCQKYNMDLVFLETPKYIKINEDDVYNKLMREFVEFLAERNMTIILFTKTLNKVADVINESKVYSYEFDDSNPLYYIDLYHISYEGRKELTKKLKKILD